ncbi:MAG: transposase [Streptomyces sp.]|nr:transposase [Streptomyces sp.]
MPELWAGADAGKGEHHCTVIGGDGQTLLSRRVPNSEDELIELLGDVTELADGSPVTGVVDLNTGGAALWIALLVGHRQKLLYIPGRTVHHALPTTVSGRRYEQRWRAAGVDRKSIALALEGTSGGRGAGPAPRPGRSDHPAVSAVHCWLGPALQSHSWTWVPSVAE